MNPTLLNEKFLKCKSIRLVYLAYILIWQLGIVANILTFRTEELKPDSLTADTHLIETTQLISSDAFLLQQNETNKVVEGNSLNYFYTDKFISGSEDNSKQHEYSSYEYTNDVYGRKDPFLKKIIPRSPPLNSPQQSV